MAADIYNTQVNTYTTTSHDTTANGIKPACEIVFEDLGDNNFALNFFQQGQTNPAAKVNVNFRGVPDETRTIFLSAVSEIIDYITSQSLLVT